MIAIIRIAGQVGIEKSVAETLHRLRLRRKYACVVLEKPSKEELGMLRKVENFVAYGEISEEMFKKLKEARGKEGKKFFRLHPPRKGIDAKKHFGVGKGVLGNHKDQIDKLIERML